MGEGWGEGEAASTRDHPNEKPAAHEAAGRAISFSESLRAGGLLLPPSHHQEDHSTDDNESRQDNPHHPPPKMESPATT